MSCEEFVNNEKVFKNGCVYICNEKVIVETNWTHNKKKELGECDTQNV